MIQPYIRQPRSTPHAFTTPQVARAYNYPKYTGKGYTVGIIELGGGYRVADISAAAHRLGVSIPNIVSVDVAGGHNTPGGEADGEVLLDIQIVMGVAPGAHQRVYFAPNTDAGFLAAINQAIADKVNVISISWGGPETSWSSTTMQAFEAAFASAKAQGIVVFAASGDTGSKDGTSANVVDFPASSPSVIGCGGTRLTVNSDGSRNDEVTWDDNDTTSATGGGSSKQFLGRDVPDIAANADPVTGYEVIMDGQLWVFGGTSCVAPLYAGLVLLLSEAIGAPLGSKVDFMNLLLTNLSVCFDVTAGDNGGYRAGLGRDKVTGLGVVDGGKLLQVLVDQTPDPQPTPTPPPSEPTPPVTDPTPTPTPDETLAKEMRAWLTVKQL
jgi:kumamolisin